MKFNDNNEFATLPAIARKETYCSDSDHTVQGGFPENKKKRKEKKKQSSYRLNANAAEPIILSKNKFITHNIIKSEGENLQSKVFPHIIPNLWNNRKKHIYTDKANPFHKCIQSIAKTISKKLTPFP